MSTTWFVIWVLALMVAAMVLAYYQFGSRGDIRRMQRDLEMLRARQKEFIESVAEAVALAYDESRQQLQDARENLRELQAQAVEGLEQQIKNASEQLDALAKRLEERAKAAKEITIKAAQSIERAISLRVRRMGSRATLLRAKAKASRAASAAKKGDFHRADEFLAEATALLREARENLGDDRDYNKLLETMKAALHDATLTVRSHAENAQQTIERALNDADRLVGKLESDEDDAARK